MARLISLLSLLAFLLFLVSPLSAVAGVATAPASTTYTQEATEEEAAAATSDTEADASSGEDDSFLLSLEGAMGELQLREKATEARIIRNMIASGVAAMLLPFLAMIAYSFFLLHKAESYQEKDPQMPDKEAFQKALGSNAPGAVASAILSFLAVAAGGNFVVQAGKLLGRKRERDQEEFEKMMQQQQQRLLLQQQRLLLQQQQQKEQQRQRRGY